MADYIHGNGLFDVHDTLARLAADPASLDRAVQRFGGVGDDGPPPPYWPPSSDSGTSAQPDSPVPVLARARAPEAPSAAAAARRAQREIDLRLLHERSHPSEQFDIQSSTLALRLAMRRYDEKEEGAPFPRARTNERVQYVLRCLKDAEGLVRARWQEQGIWPDAWSAQPSYEDQWPHEDAYGTPILDIDLPYVTLL